MTTEQWLEIQTAKKELANKRLEKKIRLRDQREQELYNKRNRIGLIYCISSVDCIVIGKTIDLKKRLSVYNADNPYIELLYTKESSNIDEEERLLLSKINDHFKPFKGNEWFKKSNELLMFLKDYFYEKRIN